MSISCPDSAKTMIPQSKWPAPFDPLRAPVVMRARLDEIRALYADVVRSMPSGLLTVDEGGRVLSLNPAGEEILGRHANEILGRPLGEAAALALASSAEFDIASNIAGLIQAGAFTAVTLGETS